MLLSETDAAAPREGMAGWVTAGGRGGGVGYFAPLSGMSAGFPKENPTSTGSPTKSP